jgi:hypothetical protein
MFKYPRYLIHNDDHFNIQQFPSLNDKISDAVVVLSGVSEEYRGEMLVSFLKSHSISSEWSANNPEFAGIISSEALPFKDLEDLFESGRNNTAFTGELEAYLKDVFNIPPVLTDGFPIL